jgi:hypothetical protein
MLCAHTSSLTTNISSRLSTPPETLDQLGESLSLLEQLQTDLSKIEARFPPLHQQFAILEKYEVAVSPEVQPAMVSFVLLIFAVHPLLSSLTA